MDRKVALDPRPVQESMKTVMKSQRNQLLVGLNNQLMTVLRLAQLHHLKVQKALQYKGDVMIDGTRVSCLQNLLSVQLSLALEK